MLSYLANGLRVVSVRIPVIERAEIAPLISFYDGNDGRAIAEAINNVDIASSYDSRTIIKGLDDKLTNVLKDIL